MCSCWLESFLTRGQVVIFEKIQHLLKDGPAVLKSCSKSRRDLSEPGGL